MKILVVGSGGREHALCLAIRRSPLCTGLLCAPGNAGIAETAICHPIPAENVDALVTLAQTERVDLVVVGPEAPLVAGLVDKLEAADIRAFGPRAAAARLEGSKAFMKEICDRAGIPTAAWGRFTDAEAAKRFIRQKGAPIVVKADGLAAGKGVVVASTIDEALAAVDQIMGARVFGMAGDEVVIEEFLAGEEASFFAICDGTDAIAIGAAQDHKRVGDGDTGPNTGGMGAYTPAPIVTPAIEAMVMERIVQPTLRTMAESGAPFRGVLFAGLMIDKGEAKLLEFNTRFGDPECEALMARLDSDLVPLLVAVCEGKLATQKIAWKPEPAIAVVMATTGYPGAYGKGSAIRGLDLAAHEPGVTILHGATGKDAAGQYTAQGGRVLDIVATGKTLAEARNRAYRAIDRIDWKEGFCRKDIGIRGLAAKT
ncbi:MAG TPA: phosphoribosylamine--glycine ligase [Magnetospirillaceae bacterium]|jgi:phosphoribosylamine--glycine ligase